MRNYTSYYEPTPEPWFHWWQIPLIVAIPLGTLGAAFLWIALLLVVAYLLLHLVRSMVRAVGTGCYNLGVSWGFYTVAVIAGMVAWAYYGIYYC